MVETSAFVVLFLASISLQSASAQIAFHAIHLGDLYHMQNGIGWPHTLKVTIGHEALLKLVGSFENPQSCEVTTPAGDKFDAYSPSSNRYETWGEDCGVRVKNVVLTDHGRWRLTATRGNNSITGWTELQVQDTIDHYDGSAITLQDGQTKTNIELSTLSNAYCLVEQPFTDSSLVQGHCSVTLDRATRAVQGNWHVLLGLPGRVSELQVDRSVAVESERLDTGFVHGTNPSKLHLYCNIQNTVKNITFCRFQKSTDRAGFNIMDGLSDGSYSYYGDGFSKRHCGMTIESPTANDYATWRCTVGVKQWSDNSVVQATPLQALIRVINASTRNVNKNLNKQSEATRTIFAQREQSFTISCQANASLSYCWFQHPNGSQITPVVRDNSLDREFWYTGESLSVGNCGITFNRSTDDDSGLWTCHMGPDRQMGIEITDKVNVRVTGPLAAREKEVVGTIGESATLYCHTSNGNRPLDYCRFLMPNSVGISIDATVTQEEAILGRFYFTPGHDLNFGDCSLTINPVFEEDVGEWTCAALVELETLEAADTITVITQEPPRSQAGVIGMSVGISSLVVALAGVLGYKYRSKFSWRRFQNNSRSDGVSLQTMSSGGRSSIGSSTTSSSETSQREV